MDPGGGYRAASATTGNSITQVQLWLRQADVIASGATVTDTLLTTLTAAPYQYTWSSVINPSTGGQRSIVPGSYTLYAVVSDSSGATSTSAPVPVEVRVPTVQGESITFVHTDAVGSVIATTDEGGAVLWKESYAPYGQRLRNDPAATGNRVFYEGKAYDTTSGLMIRARATTIRCWAGSWAWIRRATARGTSTALTATALRTTTRIGMGIRTGGPWWIVFFLWVT